MQTYTEVFSWGGDHFGQLGLAGKQIGLTYSIPRYCSFNITIRQLACGEEHTVFIAQNGHVYSMGNNCDGRLGINSHNIRQSSSPCLVEDLVDYNCVGVSCGWGHTAVVTQEGYCFTWGVGEFGALCYGGLESQWRPVKALISGNALQVSCGSRHTGILWEYRGQIAVSLCGAGEAGQLGTGQRERETTPQQIQLPEEIKQIACGVFHTLFLVKSGRVYSTGGNSFGQLGVGGKKSTSTPMRVVSLENVQKVSCGYHSAAITRQGELFIWGTGVFGEFLMPKMLSIPCKIVDVSIGGSFGAAISVDNSLWTWGSNSNGELGQGDYEPRGTPAPILSLRGRKVMQISCGGCYAIALGSDINRGNPSPIRHMNHSMMSESNKSPLERSFNIKSYENLAKRSPLKAFRVHTPSQQRCNTFEDQAYDTLDTSFSQLDKSYQQLNETNMQRILDLELSIQEKDSSYEVLRKKFNLLVSKLESTTKELNNSRYEYRTMEAELRNQIQMMEQQLPQEGFLDDLQQQIHKSNLTLQKEERKFQQLQKDYQQVYKELEFQKEFNQNLANDNQQFQEQLEQINSDESVYNQRVETLENSLGIMQDREQDLQEEIRKLKQQLQDKDDQLKQALTEKETFNDALQNMSNQYSVLYEEVTVLKQNQQKLGNTDRITEKLQRQLQDMENQWNDSLERVESLEQYIRDLEQSNKQLQNKNEDLRYQFKLEEVKNQERLKKFELEIAKEYKEKSFSSQNTPQQPSPKPQQSVSTVNYSYTPSEIDQERTIQSNLLSPFNLQEQPIRPFSPFNQLNLSRDRYRDSEPNSPSLNDISQNSEEHYMEDDSFSQKPQYPIHSNITDMRAKLAALQQSKSLLESRMQQFEQRLITSKPHQ